MRCRMVSPLGIVVLSLLPSIASGQTVSRIEQCTDLINRRIEAYKSGDWQALVDKARQFMGECSDIEEKASQADALYDIGMSLDKLKQPEDAIPVLRRCVATQPDRAPCWVELGEASESLGRVSEAKSFYRKAIETGGFDELNAASIGLAKSRLSLLDQQEELRTQLRKLFPEKPEAPPGKGRQHSTGHTFGTGFFASRDGDILTNNHVVAGCRTVATRDGKPLRLVTRSAGSDLALLKADSAPSSVAVFRSGPAPKLGDAVVAFGFPLPGLLSSEGNVSTGVLSATAGLGNDVRFAQISAPVQPGNSGGALFDSSGHVIGVVVAKLDALQVARATGDVPQNVNFAVHWSEVRAFLDEQGVKYRKEPSQRELSTRDIAAAAAQITVAIDCTR